MFIYLANSYGLFLRLNGSEGNVKEDDKVSVPLQVFNRKVLLITQDYINFVFKRLTDETIFV